MPSWYVLPVEELHAVQEGGVCAVDEGVGAEGGEERGKGPNFPAPAHHALSVVHNWVYTLFKQMFQKELQQRFLFFSITVIFYIKKTLILLINSAISLVF